MRRWSILACALVAVLAWGGVAQAGVKSRVSLNFYRATVSQAKYQKLLAQGPRHRGRQDDRAGRMRLELVLTQRQASALRAKGITRHGCSGTRRARPHDRPQPPRMSERLRRLARLRRRGRAPRMYCTRLAAGKPAAVKLEVIGHTGKGREIIALKVTPGARTTMPDGSAAGAFCTAPRSTPASGSRPRSTGVCSSGSSTSGGRTTSRSRTCCKPRELWFVLVCNPDGYQYTFQSPDTRLWRKNLREQNGRARHPGRRRRRPEPQLSRALGTTTARARRACRRATPIAVRRKGQSPRPRRSRASSTASTSASRSTTTPSGSGSSTRRAGRSGRLRATTRSSTRCRETRTTPRSTASLRGSRRTSST